MLRQFRKGRRRLEELARRPIPAPVDMLNLITLRSGQTYKWYGLTVMPVLTAVGGRLQWLGYRTESIHGSPQADKLMIVRFPNHRRFLAMVANPYFALVNKIREAAVEYFELSFTYAHVRVGKLSDSDVLAGLHYNPSDPGLPHDAVARVFEEGPGRLVYASSEQSPIDLFGKRLKGSDPHPLTFKRLALIAYDEEGQARADLEARLASLGELAGELSVHLYRRGALEKELPWARAA